MVSRDGGSLKGRSGAATRLKVMTESSSDKLAGVLPPPVRKTVPKTAAWARTETQTQERRLPIFTMF